MDDEYYDRLPEFLPPAEHDTPDEEWCSLLVSRLVQNAKGIAARPVAAGDTPDADDYEPLREMWEDACALEQRLYLLTKWSPEGLKATAFELIGPTVRWAKRGLNFFIYRTRLEDQVWDRFVYHLHEYRRMILPDTATLKKWSRIGRRLGRRLETLEYAIMCQEPGAIDILKGANETVGNLSLIKCLVDQQEAIFRGIDRTLRGHVALCQKNLSSGEISAFRFIDSPWLPEIAISRLTQLAKGSDSYFVVGNAITYLEESLKNHKRISEDWLKLEFNWQAGSTDDTVSASVSCPHPPPFNNGFVVQMYADWKLELPEADPIKKILLLPNAIADLFSKWSTALARKNRFRSQVPWLDRIRPNAERRGRTQEKTDRKKAGGV